MINDTEFTTEWMNKRLAWRHAEARADAVKSFKSDIKNNSKEKWLHKDIVAKMELEIKELKKVKVSHKDLWQSLEE